MTIGKYRENSKLHRCAAVRSMLQPAEPRTVKYHGWKKKSWKNWRTGKMGGHVFGKALQAHGEPRILVRRSVCQPTLVVSGA